MCKCFNILPANHFGARPSHTTTDSLHLLVKKVKDAWRARKVASTLFLDVQGAFPSMAVDWLLHNMWMQGILMEYMEWMKRRLIGWQTALVFDDHQKAYFAINNRLDQGDPFSGCCYLIYNTDLLKIPMAQHGKTILLFVDDTAVLIVEKTFTDAHQRLKEIMEWAGGIFDWAHKHNCEFGIEKFQLVNFSWWLIPNSMNPRKK